MSKSNRISPFFISVLAAVGFTVAVCIFAFSCQGAKLKFKTCFYFVCYAMEDNSISAGSISSAVSAYGGAGYIIEHGGKYYITVSCYYEEKDAENVCRELKDRNLSCSVLKIETEEYRLKTSYAKKHAELYRGNLNTLNSLARLAYDCANALDTGAYNQSNAKSVIADIKSGLKSLLSANENKCFTIELKRLIAECDDAAGGIIYSKDLRKLQIATADTIIHIELF